MEKITGIATAHGVGGVAIVRVSGDNVLQIAKEMFSYRGEYEPNV